MENPGPLKNDSSSGASLSFFKRIIYSRPIQSFIRIRFISWIIEKGVGIGIRFLRRNSIASSQDLSNAQKSSSKQVFSEFSEDLKKSPLDVELQLIAVDIVHSLGYAGAMVAAYEQGDALPARALYVHPSIATRKQIEEWEEQVRKISPPDSPISITDPDIARVYVNDDKYKDNLSVRAAKARVPVTSNELFDLFTPIAPDVSRPFIKGLQNEYDFRQVIAVPFFIFDTNEYVGNLFVVKQKDNFTDDEKGVLDAFSHHAATAIQGERRRLQSDGNQKLVFDMQRNISDESQILDEIATGVVTSLGYAGAMVATYEQGDALPARALYVHPSIATRKQIEEWEEQVRKISPPDSPISITDPDIARVYVNDDKYKDNLSVKAAKARVPVTSNELFDLFTPIAPGVSRPFIKGLQNGLGIRQVIAVPFFLNDELVGNLFAATKSEKFDNWEIELLQTFGQNAAVGLRNARLYRQSEERRKATEILGVMAFSAVTSIHTFNNHIGAIRGSFDLLGKFGYINQTEQAKSLTDIVTRRLDDVSELLKQLDKPAEIKSNIPVSVNACIERAIEKLVKKDGPSWLNMSLDENLPNVFTSQEMLTEAFRILIKNSFEALSEAQSYKKQDPEAWVRSRLSPDGKSIEIEVQDNGTGIKPENLTHLFEFKQTTKREKGGLGFGLFWTRNYIEGLDGNITIRTEWQKGTTVIVSIPSFLHKEIAKNS